MTEQVGGIEYRVGADTKPLAQSEKVVDKATDRMAASFDKVDFAVDQVTGSLLDFNSAAAKGGKKANDTLKGAGTAANDAGDKTNKFRNSLGQLGFQLQDFVVQIQGGTSFLTAFAQQGSQAAGVFGPTGAIVGAVIATAAALGSALLPALTGSTKKTEELTKKIRELAESTVLTAAQSRLLVEQESKIITEASKRTVELERQIETLKKQRDATKGLIDDENTLQTAIKDLRKTYNRLDREINTLQATIDTENQAIDKATKNIELYNSIKGDKAVTANKDQAKALQELISGLVKEAETLGLSNRQLALRIASQNKATEIDKAAINAIFDKIEAYEAEQKAEEERKRLRTQVQGAATALLSPEEQLKIQLQKEIDLFNEAERQKVISEQAALELRKKAQENYANRVKQLNKDAVDGQKILADIASTFEARASSALAGIITGAQSGEQAIRGLAQAILTQAIQALIKLGIQSAAAQGAAVASNSASAAALSAAYSTPAALASLASFGANAGPANAAIASTIATTKALAAGRQFGGPTSRGNVYQVGEQNRPEVLTEAGKSYLLPGNRGNITPMDGAGSAPVVNNITFVTDPRVEISEGSNEENATGGTDREFIVSVIDSQLSNQGSSTSRIMKNNYATSGRLAGQRRS